jgi:UDP-2-acetamido-2,6-beta-L-arabino-hexul-4-ose reductase
MRILITGSKGFIGKNLLSMISNRTVHSILEFNRGDSSELLTELIGQADFIFHLAGENRPHDIGAFEKVNIDLTQKICELISLSNKKIPLIFSSSTQAGKLNAYGESKLKAERIIEHFSHTHNNPCCIYRLPGVFGKWCKPNYNSVVATFCNNIAQGLPIDIHDADKSLSLIYIDDVVDEFSNQIHLQHLGVTFPSIGPVYSTSLGELADTLNNIRQSRFNLITERVGAGLTRALYSTYLSYLTPKEFSYPLESHADPRGIFVEMLKTPDCGQFSFFTALPGITRGGHFHDSKSEKFLVVSGKACFRFRHVLTNEIYELLVSDQKMQVVESIPGWAHDVTNIGNEKLIVLLWANELFNPAKPDTFQSTI